MPASRTSIWAAAARAFGAREPDIHVRNRDWLAERFLGPEERALLGDHPLLAALEQPYEDAVRNMEVLGSARLLIARTHFIDDRLEVALRDGIRQVVIMGAGFDTRSYRWADQLKESHVIEVDQPSTQQLKTRRVREVLGEIPANVTYAPIDFTSTSLSNGLAQAGYQPDQKTFFIWEGVTMYLPGDTVQDTLRWIATNAPSGTSIVFDYTYQSAIEMMAKADLEQLPVPVKQAMLRFRQLTAGEPWIFGLPYQNEKEFVNALGFELRQVMGMNSSEAVLKYLTRADGSIFGSMPATDRQGYLILEAGLV